MPDSTPVPTVARRRRPARDVAFIICWLLGTVFAFWWHGPGNRYASGSPSSVAEFDATRNPDMVRWLVARSPASFDSTTALTLLQLRDPRCTCNRGTDPKFDALRRKYAARGIRVETIAVDRATRGAPAWLAATPAAALLDAKGTVLYLGPIDDTAFCSRAATTPVERALDSALAGSPVPARPMLVTGCFCA